MAFSFMIIKILSNIYFTYNTSGYQADNRHGWRKASLRLLGPDSIKRCHLTSTVNPIVEIRWSYDRLISTMGFPILIRWHIYIESGPRARNSMLGCICCQCTETRFHVPSILLKVLTKIHFTPNLSTLPSIIAQEQHQMWIRKTDLWKFGWKLSV